MTSVFLADLRHNYSGVLANDCMPLGVGYMKAEMDRSLPEVDSRVFAYPNDLFEAMSDAPPDVLMLSNYMWNKNLSLRFAALAKEMKPETFVVMGGPNIAIEPERKLDFMRRHPALDAYVLGEGDFLAAELVKLFLDAGKSLDRLGNVELPSSIQRVDGELKHNPMWNRHKTVDEIPSPWLSGALDPFFDGKLAPMMETNRGCPFTCTFCVQGTTWYTKVHYFDEARLKEEIDYIGAKIQKDCPTMGTLRIADSNYGMFERDVDLSAFVGDAQKKYGWPVFIDATTGKNRPERIIESLEKMSGALVLYQAVQSLDDRVLGEIKRSNIKKEAYEQIMIHVRGRGLRSLSDLILGLPGETLETHLDSVRALIDAGTHEMHNFQSMMLAGSEMEMSQSREKYGFVTRFRVLPKNFGSYVDEEVFDVDEIVVATDTMSFDDYVTARKYHLACSMLWNNSWFDHVVAFARNRGIQSSEWLDEMVRAMSEDDGVVGRLVDDFVRATKEELFETEEECREFYRRPENFARLEGGEIGDNLMYRFRALGSFFEWKPLSAMVMRATKRLLEARGAAGRELDQFWEDFSRYVELSHACGTTIEELLSPASADLQFDVPAWIEAGCPADVAGFAHDRPVSYEFHLSPDGHRELEKAIAVWTTDLRGLTKGVTRIRPSAQARQCRPTSLTTAEVTGARAEA